MVRHGYTLADLDRLAVRTVMGGRRWWPAGNRLEQYETAWSAIAEALAATLVPPPTSALMRAGARALSRDVGDYQRDHGTRQAGRNTGGNTGGNFARYWEWHARPVPAPEASIVEHMALRQVIAALPPGQRRALAALAVTGDRAAAAGLLEMTEAAYSSALGRARRDFLALWHEGEPPSQVWRRTRTVASRQPGGQDAARARAAAARARAAAARHPGRLPDSGR